MLAGSLLLATGLKGFGQAITGARVGGGRLDGSVPVLDESFEVAPRPGKLEVVAAPDSVDPLGGLEMLQEFLPEALEQHLRDPHSLAQLPGARYDP